MGGVQFLTFRHAGTHAVSRTATYAVNTSGYAQVEVLEPNHLMSNQAAFELICIHLPPPPADGRTPH